MLDDDITSTGRPVFLRALRVALGRMPLWLLTWFVGLLLASSLAFPWGAWFGDATAERYPPSSVLGSMSEVFRQDHGADLSALREGGGRAAAALALVMMLFGVFSGGGWLQVFLERTSGHSLRRFLWGGAKYFWRFLRVWLLTLFVLSFFAWLWHGWPWETLMKLLVGPTDEDMEVVTSEWTSVWIEWIRSGLFAGCFATVLVWADYTRTRMALHDGSSAVWAGLCSAFLMVLHPVRMIRPMALILALEVAVVVSLGAWAWDLNTGVGSESTWTSIAYLFVVGQGALLWQAISRAARYSAAVQVTHMLVAPLAQPDPWASRIGGPGGPQYPVDDTDDYGVSI